jgi:predicted transcriptional regulator
MAAERRAIVQALTPVLETKLSCENRISDSVPSWIPYLPDTLSGTGGRGLRDKELPQSFQTQAQVNRYFGNKTISCLLCHKEFQRLASHLAYKHHMTAEQYKELFGLPWTRGLTSASSHRKSGWSAERRIKAGKLARRTRFFEHAHPAPRRESPNYIRRAFVRNLGIRATGFGKRFEQRVCALFKKGLIDREIAHILGVNRMTVNLRTRKWRRQKGRTT